MSSVILKPCPQCNGNVRTDASECPHCGGELAGGGGGFKQYFFIFMVVVILAAGGWFLLSGAAKNVVSGIAKGGGGGKVGLESTLSSGEGVLSMDFVVTNGEDKPVSHIRINCVTYDFTGKELDDYTTTLGNIIPPGEQLAASSINMGFVSKPPDKVECEVAGYKI